MSSLATYSLEDLLAEIARRRNMIENARILTAPWRPEVRRVLAATAPVFGLTIDDLFMATRRTRITTARHCAMAALRQCLDLTYQEIGEIFACDHGTVMHACRAHNMRVATEADYAKKCFNVLRAYSTTAA